MVNRFEYKFSFSQEEVELFAKVTGDNNPIHINPEYAKKTLFRQPIIHGFLAGSVFSKVFGTLFPGEGTIYLKQEMLFVAPMFVNRTYKAVFVIDEVDSSKGKAKVTTTILDSNDKETIVGKATIINEKFKNES